MVWKIALPDKVTSLNVAIFIMHVCKFIMGATPMFMFTWDGLVPP